MMVAVDGDTSWQLHKQKKNHEDMNVHILLLHVGLWYEINEDSLQTT